MRSRLDALLSLALPLVASCSRGDAAPPPPAPAVAPSASPLAAPPSLGNVMTEVAHRFELTGRAFNASRFDLAAFEAGELGELFESDVPIAELPKEGPTAHIRPTARAFLDVAIPDLQRQTATHDPALFAAAYARTANACNACHQASAKPFIQIPSIPGHPVPDLDPLPAPPKR